MIIPAARYLVVGLLGTVTHLCLLYIAVEFVGMSPLPGSGAAFIWVVIQSYLLNRNWTFQSIRGHNSALPRYLAVSGIGFMGNLLIMYVMLDIFGLWYMLAQASAAIVIPIMNFLLNKYWTFA
jgi:putative flippase GtrA